MKRLFTKIVDVKPDELRALWLAFVFNFVVLAGYYILRPIREEIGATSGVENLPWMYTATLIGMLIANALFAAIVSRMSRRKFLPLAYRFAIANLFIFFVLMRFVPANWQWLLARSFFGTRQAPLWFHRGGRFVGRDSRSARPDVSGRSIQHRHFLPYVSGDVRNRGAMHPFFPGGISRAR